jgi:hypothetical protein
MQVGGELDIIEIGGNSSFPPKVLSGETFGRLFTYSGLRGNCAMSARGRAVQQVETGK